MKVLETHRPVRDAVMGVHDQNRGEYRWININAFPMQTDEADQTGTTPAGQPELVMVTIEDISQRKQYEASLERQLQEKTVLLKETHHRIKNNIATVGSLLSLQADASRSAEVSAALQEAMSRLASMRELYEKMLLTDDFGKLPAGDYLDGLAQAVLQLFGATDSVELATAFDEVEMSAKQLFPLGIIVNELITNALKYAFAGRAGPRLELALKQHADGLRLLVSDNGAGLPARFDPEKTDGFGLMLVRMLCSQLKATLSVRSECGTAFVIDFCPTAGAVPGQPAPRGQHER
jgi:two-component sensor histidine kinase